jgi:SAM-dependent methyltransferase
MSTPDQTPGAEWLQANRALRMDANKQYWDAHRRDFHLGRYRYAADLVAGQRVLDAACGTGYGTAILAQQAVSATGVDISADAVKYAAANYGSDKTTFLQAPVERIPLPDGAFDCIVSFETIEHTLSPRAALREFTRLLQPKGRLIVSAPNDWGYTRDHFIDFDQALLEKLLRERFGKIDLYYNNSGRSGSFSKQAGIGPLDTLTIGRPECIIAICSDPIRPPAAEATEVQWMLETYENAMWRHRQFVAAWKPLRKWPFRWMTRKWGWTGRLPPAGPA